MTQTNDLQTLPPSGRLIEMIYGYVLSRSIAVAAQYGIADLLKDGPKSANELALDVNAHPRSLYRMLRALASVGIFEETADGRFGLTPLAEPLCSDTPDSLRAFAALQADEVHFATWAQFPYSIQNGAPIIPHKFGMSWFDWLEQNPAEGKGFHEAMTSLSTSETAAILSAYDFSEIQKLVDVGGGQGLLLTSILSKYPHMTGMLYDEPAVIMGAKDMFTAYGVADRIEAVGGNFFQSVPAGGDAYVLKHILHDWSDEECLKILGHCHSEMAAGGKLLIVEMVIPERNIPSVSKFLDLGILLFLGGTERTEAEYRALLDSTGFNLTRIVSTPSAASVIEAVRK